MSQLITEFVLTFSSFMHVFEVPKITAHTHIIVLL